jgi:hypothetical protein
VSDIDPASAEDLLHLQVEHLRIEIEGAVNPVAVNQRANGLRIEPHVLSSNARLASKPMVAGHFYLLNHVQFGATNRIMN